MDWRSWLEDELHGRGTVVAVVVALLVAVSAWFAWSMLRADDGAAERPCRLAALAPVAAPPSPGAPASQAASMPAQDTKALPACAHQHADLHLPDRRRDRACLSAMRSRQTGSVRTYDMAPEGVSSWQLAFDVAGEQVVSVRLRRPALGPVPEAFYACDAAACAEVSFGRPDASGVRTVKLDGTVLQALPAGQRWRPRLPDSALDKARPAAGAAVSASGTAPLPTVRIVASLRTEPELRMPSSCEAGGVYVVESDGAANTFCPLGGAGFELADDGTLRFAFRDLQGRELTVGLAADFSVASVALKGLRCRAPQCGGVSTRHQGDAADPEVERGFSFSGTTLESGQPGGRSATLSGSLTMPSQKPETHP